MTEVETQTIKHLDLIKESSSEEGFFDFRWIANQQCVAKEMLPSTAAIGLEENRLTNRDCRVFVGVCLRKDMENSTALGCIPSTLFFVDIDGALTEQSNNHKFDLLENVLICCDDNKLQPRAVAGSGGGIHVYFKAEEPLTIPTRRSTVRAISNLFSDCLVPGGPDLAVCDQARVVSLWGTHNSKRQRPVELWWEDVGASPVKVIGGSSASHNTNLDMLPRFDKRYDAYHYSRKFLIPLYQEFNHPLVIERAVDCLIQQVGEKNCEAVVRAKQVCEAMSNQIRWPKQGRRRMWCYAKLCKVIEIFPHVAVLEAAGEAIKSVMGKWIEQEPGQVEDIIQDLIKNRLGDKC